MNKETTTTMDKDLFDTTDVDVTAFLEDQTGEQTANAILDTLVGEGKKYKTNDDLARAKVHSDLHIKRIEEENKVLREKAAQAKGAEELMKALRANQTRTNEADRDNDFGNSNVSGGEAQQGNTALTEADITNKVLAAIEAKTTNKKQDENLLSVKKELIQQFGAEYPNVIRQKAESLNMSEEDVQALARKTPKAFFQLLGITPTQNTNVSPNPVSRASEGTTFSGSGEKTFSYYEKIRKTDQRRYMSPQIQNEILAQAFKLGANFYR
jgi:hypothetical protein